MQFYERNIKLHGITHGIEAEIMVMMSKYQPFWLIIFNNIYGGSGDRVILINQSYKEGDYNKYDDGLMEISLF